MLDSSGAMASVNASIVAITAAWEPVRAASPTDMVALSAPAERTPAVAAKIAAASGAGSPAASASEATAAAVEASNRDRQDDRPRARDSRAEQREPGPAGRGEITKHAGLEVLRACGGADDGSHDEHHHGQHEHRILVGQQPAREVLRRVGRVLDPGDGEYQRHDAEGEDDAEREHPTSAAQFQCISTDQSQVEHQARSSKRVVMVKKSCSSDTAPGLTRAIAMPSASRRRSSSVTIS